MIRSCMAGFLVGMSVIVCATKSNSQEVCRPALAFKEAQLSQMKPPLLIRKWTAVVSVDVSRCAADAEGLFEIVFVRLKESGPDLEFREQFTWHAAPTLNVAVDFSADEAVERYWIDNVRPCPCRH
jgi:hypothetical protein